MRRMNGTERQLSTDPFSTSDLKLAALMGAGSVSYLGSYINQRNKVTFSFQRCPEQEKILNQYLSGDILVNPIAYDRFRDYLKSEIFRLREGGKSNKVADVTG